MYDTVICIPYRNRKAQLSRFLSDVVPLLPKDFHVVVIEQDDNRMFNRGALLNIAHTLFKEKTTYLMTHDVDIYPTQETINTLYTKPVDENHVLGIYTSVCNTLGGIIKFRPATFQAVNGFPNDYWGWGVEDKALQNRCETYAMTITKTILNNDPERTKYFTILNDVDDRVKPADLVRRTHKDYHQFPYLTRSEKIMTIMKSGLNSLVFEAKESNTNDTVTHYVVKIL